MHLTEQHVITRNDPRYSVIDAAAFASKNLYNAGNYEVRQSYIQAGQAPTSACRALPEPASPTGISL